ncbi:MAG: hypothetical protein LBH84_06625, partial [Prevotellaceae bacterium]|nr:hypothetical protein [Prevotellaceae bacterium]
MICPLTILNFHFHARFSDFDALKIYEAQCKSDEYIAINLCAAKMGVALSKSGARTAELKVSICSLHQNGV